MKNLNLNAGASPSQGARGYSAAAGALVELRILFSKMFISRSETIYMQVVPIQVTYDMRHKPVSATG